MEVEAIVKVVARARRVFLGFMDLGPGLGMSLSSRN